MNEVEPGSAVRCEVDGLAGDIEFIRKTWSISIFLLIIVAAGGWNGSLSSVLLAVAASVVGVTLLGARRGKPASSYNKRIVAAAAATIIAALIDLAGTSEVDREVRGMVYGTALAVMAAAGIAGRKARRIQYLLADHPLNPPVALLGKKSQGKRVRFVMPPIHRWPGAIAWAMIAAICKILGATIAAILVIVTQVLSYLIPVPNLLQLLGSRTSRPLFNLAAKAAHMVRRYQAIDARDLLSADSRPPVLLLRSFGDDNREISDHSDFDWLGESGETFEEVLTKKLESYGPVVAIGKPGEKVPSAGAAREYLSDDVWQARVQELVTASALIVVIAGKTKFLGWELARIEALGALSKLLVVIPADSKAEAADRLVTIVESLHGTRISELIKAHLRTDAIVVQFGPTLIEFASQNRAAQDYAIAVDVGAWTSLYCRA